MQKAEIQEVGRERISDNQLNLLNDLGERLSEIIESSNDIEGLKVARETIDWHIGVLEKVRENVPDVRKPAISLIISSSMRAKTVVDEVIAGVLSPETLPEADRGKVTNRLRTIARGTSGCRDRE